MEQVAKARPAPPVELSIAGWFILVAAVTELCFGRLASLLGVYLGVGVSGPRAWLADAGEVAMYCAGLASLTVLLTVLPPILADRRYPGSWWRGIVILVSPVYLLVTALAAFAPRISPWLVLAAYLTAVLMAAVVAGAAASARIEGGVRRAIVALAAANVLQAFGWTALDFFEVDREGALGGVAIRAYLIAEAIWVVAPFIAFFGLVASSPAKAGAFLRRPHLLGLLSGIAVAAIGIAIALRTSGQGAYLAQVAYLALGVTLSVPGAPWIYVASAFFAALTAACLVFPSGREPVDASSRRLGLGFAFVWIAGLQPYRVFQFALMMLGFALAARGAIDRMRAAPAAQLSKGDADGTFARS
jgi:hypothetical protein